MSRIGKMPVPLPENVSVSIGEGVIKVKGPKGELEDRVNPLAEVGYDEDKRVVVVSRLNDSRQARAVHGLQRALINNMVIGVTAGYTRQIEIHGTGYTADVNGNELSIQVGFAHPVIMEIPAGIEVEIEQRAAQPNNPARFTMRGMDKQEIGQFAAEIRHSRPPEPYNGKGIRYGGEQIRRKEGKAGIGAGGV